MKPSSWFRSRYGQTRFRLVDINCMAYLGLIAVILIFFHKTVSAWPKYVLIHLALIIVILEIVRLGEQPSRKPGLWILRIFYPVAVILFGWGEIDALARLFFGSYWATDSVIRADMLIFGAHPTVWVQQFYRPWLDELMAVFYFSYYLFFPLATIPLFIKKKYEETLAAFSVATLALFLNFFLFFLMPVLSPPMTESLNALQTRKYSGFIFAALNRLIQARGAVRGGTFPSSHITEALAWALITLRYNRKMGSILLPAVLGVAISAVYLNYHHGLDPIAGFLLGALLYPVGLKILKARDEDPKSGLHSSSDP